MAIREFPLKAIPSPLRGEGWGRGEQPKVPEQRAASLARPATFLSRLQAMPPLHEEGLWPAQITAINNLEHSLKENVPLP